MSEYDRLKQQKEEILQRQMSETKSAKAVLHILKRMTEDGRLAWLMGPGSQSYELLTEAYAETSGKDLAEFRKEFNARLTPERCPRSINE